jgi:S-methylmethionine-dependent homocysteine/selenocysteine methylase
MGEQDRSDHATNVTETEANITAVGDIVERLTMLFWSMKDEGRVQDKNTLADAIAQIERLQAQVREQAMELLIAHSEALGLYDLTTLPAKEAT